MDQAPKQTEPSYVTDAASAAGLVRKANRILVIGCSGGGKSTLSQRIAKDCDLTYISVDRDVFWLPGWVERDKREQREIFAARVLEERWIMDGNNPSSFDIRLPRTDFVIWVRMPRLLCVWGAATRALRWLGRTRPEMAPGCLEKVDLPFLWYIWTFEEKFTPRFIAGIVEHGPHVPVFQIKSRGEMRRLLDLLSHPA